jgi:hypothetical protein
MTYYEEMGVSGTASPEEIRQAYKHLARLVHPDQCGNEETRRLADLQMKRLNGIAATLLDPVSRGRYDRSLISLALAVSGEPAAVGLRWDWRRLAPPAIAVSAALMILVLGTSPLRTPRLAAAYMPRVADAISAPKPSPHTTQKSHNPVRIQTPEPEEEWEPLVTYAYESHLSVPPLPFPDTQVPPAAPRQANKPASAKQIAALTGDWFYVPASSTEAGYPPEYVELRLREDQGMLHGRYQARYRVNDQAISPNVSFQFEGQSDKDGGSFSWRGTGGSSGTVMLHRLSSGNLEVKWEADRLGNQLGLVSGTATLVRRVD